MLGRIINSEHLSAKVLALDALRTNVMIADSRLNIVYMNPSVRDLLLEAEADLKKELPRFSVDTLIGSNIDVFHKNPSHQRGMLAQLKQRHSATISVGKRVFDLLVTPLMKGSRRVGFVVEWANAQARLANLDYAAQIDAIGRSQASIEFKVDGTVITANDKFLGAMGYTLGEIVGRPHGMFADAAYRDSKEYAEFWEKLRA
jgi:methyl-accepting chemotaxis protein